MTNFIELPKGILKIIRLEAGLTQEEAASTINTQVRRWQAWELGENRIPRGKLEMFLIKTDLLDDFGGWL